jgi:hypothetical protein
MTESMIGKWDSYYKDWPKGQVGMYGQGTTLELSYDWLKDCPKIEDWGAGRGYFISMCKPGQGRGLDCSCTPWAEEQVDFVSYTSQVAGINMRGVLEHNYEWEKVLRNALKSFTQRMSLVLFTPFAEKQYDAWPDPTGVPCWSFAQSQIEDVLRDAGVKWHLQKNIPVKGMFPVEHVFYIWREGCEPIVPGMELERSASVDLEELFWLYTNARIMNSVTELGSFIGRSTTALLSACKGPVYAVDRWPGTEAHEKFMRNCGEFKNLRDIWEFSARAISKVPDTDMVFVDADHRYQFALEDMRLWEPKARVLICGHDYGRDEGTDPNDPYGNEVRRAVDDYFGKGNYEVFNSIWYKWKVSK